MEQGNSKEQKRPEKIIINMNTAAFLVLCGCKLNRTKADMLRPHRFVFFFEETSRLKKCLGIYENYRQQLYDIQHGANGELRKGVQNDGV